MKQRINYASAASMPTANQLINSLEEIFDKKITVLSGEVDEHDGEPFYQVFAQFDDGSEFLIDGENMGTSEEYINGGRIKGSSTQKDHRYFDRFSSKCG